MNPTTVALLSFAGIASIFAALGMFVRDLVAGGERDSGELRRLPLARHERVYTGMFSGFDNSFRRFVMETGIDTTPWTVIAVMVLCGLLTGSIAYFYTQEDVMVASLFGMMGMILPVPYLRYRRMNFVSSVREQLPEILDLVARALRAGESLDQALDLAGEKGGEPLGKEFRRAAKQMQMGLALSAAMRAMRYRVPVMEMQIFTTTLAVYRQTGGNLALTLERMSTVIRDRLAYQRQVRGATAAGRFSATIVSSAGPVLFCFMFLFQPEYAQKLIQSPLGQSMLAIAIFLEVVGLIWIYRLSRLS